MNQQKPQHLAPQDLLTEATLIYSAEAIKKAICKIATDITQSLENTTPIIICTMTGGLVFAGQLLTQLKFLLEVDYAHASRYQNNIAHNTLTWHSMPNLDLNGRTVLLLDDILDEGMTLLAMKEKCLSLGALQVFSAVLIEKKLPHTKPIKADFVGLQAPNEYLFGFGMDVDGYFRNLPAIYVLPEGLSKNVIFGR